MYKLKSKVRFSEIDHTKKLTLPSVINYFQDCSTFQSEELGVGFAFLEQHKKAWVLNFWQIVVERYPKIGEEIEVSTWPTDFRGYFGNRNFLLKDADGEVIACANSLWVFMDMETGRPTKPDMEDIKVYGVEPPYEMEYAPRKIKTGETYVERDGFPVRRYHIDTNMHVNNCQYVQMAQEVLDEQMEVRQVRVEYKKSAVLGDVIIPKVAVEEKRTVVELCDTSGAPYAMVEFIGE